MLSTPTPARRSGRSQPEDGRDDFRQPGLRTSHSRNWCDLDARDRSYAGCKRRDYVVAMSKDASGNYHQRLHALDLALGTELFSGPMDIQASFPGSGDNTNDTSVGFDPKQYKERAALLLLNGVIYTSWASHCDIRPYTGWIMGYSESTLAQTSVLNITPNGNEGASGCQEPASPPTVGQHLFLDANGDFDTTVNAQGFPSGGDYGNAFIKLSTTGSGNQLAVADFFEMDNEASENGSDTDLGSGGTIVLPDLTDGSGNTWHLAVGAGKDGNLYAVSRDSMGKFSPNNGSIYQELAGALPGGVLRCPRISTTRFITDRWGSHPGVHHRQRETVNQRHRANQQQLWLSGDDAKRLGERRQQRNRLGRGEPSPAVLRLQCQHAQRALQQQPGQWWPRSVRRGQ